MLNKRSPQISSLPVANYSSALASALEWLGDRYLLARPVNASRLPSLSDLSQSRTKCLQSMALDRRVLTHD
jgi:hypothetical protein